MTGIDALEPRALGRCLEEIQHQSREVEGRRQPSASLHDALAREADQRASPSAFSSSTMIHLSPRRQLMYVFVRTNNPRPTFHLDMTDAERQVMQQHVAYWTEKGRQGIAVVFGPVLDPKGVYGIGIYNVDDLAHMRRLLADDPAGEILEYEVFEMPRAVVGSHSSSSG